MRRAIAVLAALVAATMVTACEQATPTAVRPTTSAVGAKAPQPIGFTFTKIPAVQDNAHAITSPVANLDALVFQMDAVQAEGLVVKQFGFSISGGLAAGDVANLQLVYYPKGLKKPGVVLGTNDASTWVAPGGASILTIDLASPITIPNGKSFTGVFALRVDVNGAGAFFFVPAVQTCLVTQAGVDKDVALLGGNLPLRGDTFMTNGFVFGAGA